MSVRLGALLCLTGLAACSNQSEPAKDPSYVAQSSSTTDAQLTPASHEGAATRSPTPSDHAGEPRAPFVADTKETSKSELRANDGSPGQTPRAADAPTAVSPQPPSAAVAPDNTKVNERDRSSAALTPMDQKNNQSDLKITQQIRQAVMADDSLSFTGKNVKIITQNGKVTLRGPVKSDAERSTIEAAARKVAGATQVDNQLEVKK